MSRHLLPKNSGAINVASTGQWVNFSNDFSRFEDSIELPQKARINVTSIPSPWARMLLFKEAIMNSEHILHLEVMSSILDVIEIIYYERLIDFKLEAREVHLSKNDPATPFHDILYKLYTADHADDHNISITLLLATRGNDTFVLAGSSPYSLFFTPQNLQLTGKIKGYFKEDPVLLAKRPHDFQRWLRQVFLPKLRVKGQYPLLVNALEFPNGICDKCDNGTPDNNGFTSSTLFGTGILQDLFDCANKNTISSPNLLQPSIVTGTPPLVIDTSIDLINRPYYNNHVFSQNLSSDNLRGTDREILPLTNTRYPWVLPLYDFLQPCIIRYRYKLNDELLIMGQGSDELKYLPPLTEKYFEYFTPQAVDRYLSIKDDGQNSVKVTLKVPVENGAIEVTKRYTNSWSDPQHEDRILEFDSKDSSTPLPHLVLWPKLHPDNWNQPYYCLIFGERFDNRGNEIFSLEFKDVNRDLIEVEYSRKAGLYEVARLESLPARIIVTHKESGAVGVIMLDQLKFSSLTLDNSNTKVGIDFGTSHTNIAINNGVRTEVLRYCSGFSGKSLNSLDFITMHDFGDDQMNQNIPRLIKNGLSQYLYPNRLGAEDTMEEVSFPIPTMAVKEENVTNPKAILHYSVNFSKSRYFPYANAAHTAGKSVQEKTSLKWDHDVQSQAASQEYLRILMALLRCELIKRRIDPDRAQYFWAYPRSFSRVDEGRYDTMWSQVLRGCNLSKTDESKAALMYFDSIGVVSAQTPGMVIIADIGGGSSDISVWRGGSINLLTSTRWAGRDLVGHQDPIGTYSLLYDTFTSEFNDIAEKLIGFSDYQTHFNYILYSLPEDMLNNYAQSDRFYKLKFLIIYFFSALFYEIGLQSRRIVSDSLNSLNVCLAGNGARFAGWGGLGGGISDLDADVYKEILKRSMELSDNVTLQLSMSPKKKSEVAMGLCEGRQNLMGQTADYKPLIGEAVRIEGEKLDYDVSIADFDRTHGSKAYTLTLDARNSELTNFHEIFFDELGKSAIYQNSLRNDPLLQTLGNLKNQMTGDWDNIVGQLRTTAQDNFDHHSSITSSLFILGMKVMIQRLHRILSQGH